MAAESKSDDNALKFEDIIDVERELKLRNNLLNIALTPIDDSWTVHNTNNDAISVTYKQAENSNVLTVRGTMALKGGDVELFYKYMEPAFDDIRDLKLETDKLTTESRIVKAIDPDHAIVYESADSGFWIIASRDYVNVDTRMMEKDFKFGDAHYEAISAELAYSVPEKLLGDSEDHPFVQPVKNKHVRANIMTFGYVLR